MRSPNYVSATLQVRRHRCQPLGKGKTSVLKAASCGLFWLATSVVTALAQPSTSDPAQACAEIDAMFTQRIAAMSKAVSPTAEQAAGAHSKMRQPVRQEPAAWRSTSR